MSYPTERYTIDEINVNNLSYSEPRTNPKIGSKMIGVLYNDPTKGLVKPLIQTPQLASLFGISSNSFDDGPVKTTLTVSFKGMDENPKIMSCFNFYSGVDQSMIKYVSTNDQKLFKKKCSVDVINDKHSTLVRYSKDKETGEINTKWAPNINFKIPRKTDSGEITTLVFDHNKEPIENIEEVLSTKGLYVKLLVEPTVFWVSGGKFGMSWTARQILVGKRSVIKGFAFKAESDDDDEDDDDDVIEAGSGNDDADNNVGSDVENDGGSAAQINIEEDNEHDSDSDIAEICNDMSDTDINENADTPKKRGRKAKK